MRVLQIGLSKLKGGLESYALNYAHILRGKDIIFDFVDIYGEGLACEDEMETLDSKIFTLPNYKNNYLEAKKQLEDIIREGNYKCVHINMLSLASLMPIEASLNAGVVPIVHCHNADTVGIVRKILHKLNSLKLKKLPIIPLSCGKMAGEWMFGKKEFKVIPNAIDLEKFKFNQEDRVNTRKSLEVDDDVLLLGFVGRLSVQKNPCYLIDILAEILQTKSNARLLIVGVGLLENQVKEYAQSKDVADKVIFVGSHEDVGAFYSAMDVFLLPSLFEGLPVAAIEAQANGLPCVVSDMITDEVELSDLISRCSLDMSWVETIIQKSQIKNNREIYFDILAKSEYSIEKSAVELENLYIRLDKGE